MVELLVGGLAAIDLQDLQIGMRARIHGLVRRADLNGSECVVQSMAGDRCAVRCVVSGEGVRVKPCNLLRCPTLRQQLGGADALVMLILEHGEPSSVRAMAAVDSWLCKLAARTLESAGFLRRRDAHSLALWKSSSPVYGYLTLQTPKLRHLRSAVSGPNCTGHSGQRVAQSFDGGPAGLWHASSGERLGTFHCSPTERIRHLALHPCDGRTLAVATEPKPVPTTCATAAIPATGSTSAATPSRSSEAAAAEVMDLAKSGSHAQVAHVGGSRLLVFDASRDGDPSFASSTVPIASAPMRASVTVGLAWASSSHLVSLHRSAALTAPGGTPGGFCQWLVDEGSLREASDSPADGCRTDTSSSGRPADGAAFEVMAAVRGVVVSGSSSGEAHVFTVGDEACAVVTVGSGADLGVDVPFKPRGLPFTPRGRLDCGHPPASSASAAAGGAAPDYVDGQLGSPSSSPTFAAVALSSSGDWLATAGARDLTIRLHDLASSTCLCTVAYHHTLGQMPWFVDGRPLRQSKHALTELSFSGESQLVSGDGAGCLCVWGVGGHHGGRPTSMRLAAVLPPPDDDDDDDDDNGDGEPALTLS